jgi:trehalose synthase
MIETVDLRERIGLDDYASVIHLSEPVRMLRAAAASLAPRLSGRRVWMVNTTSRGGGVAEMMPKLATILRELGVDVEWVVMGASRPKFFVLTKRLHNLIHGAGDPGLGAEDRELYEVESRENAEQLMERMSRDDLLVIHDPQPLGMGAIIKRELGVPAVFRCHIGLDESNRQTHAAWDFLRPHADAYDYAVFTAPEYIPDFLAGRSGVIHPAIDPLGYKNRELSPHKLMGVLCSSRLSTDSHPVVPAPFPESVKRLAPDGSFRRADEAGGLGLLYRPMVTQISRWDRLKGYKALLDGFARLKARLDDGGNGYSERHRRRLAIVRLVLAGPDPAAVADDPEGQEVLAELIDGYRRLAPAVQADVALLSLPMKSRRENELIVNALQRASSIVVQNSVREGFGLTVTEAMWKHVAVVGSRACGIRQQIRDGVDGRLLADGQDPECIAELLDGLLDDLPGRHALGRNAQRRVHDDFLVFSQARRWIEVLAELTGPTAA